MIRAGRFLRSYFRPGALRLRHEEITFDVDGAEREATLYTPPGGGPHPGWVVLHGLTVPGRRHRSLLRFAQALASTGAAVLVPDIPSWRALQLDTAAADSTLIAAARDLAGRRGVAEGGVGVVGFSFGATRALVATSTGELRGTVRATVGFGGYCDLGRMLQSLMTGEHEWGGTRYRLEPDPYGRWIVVANYLTRVPRYAAMEAVSHGALRLALEAGTRGWFAGDAELDGVKAEIRATLSPDERRVWDLVAPPSTDPVERTPEAADLAREFTEAALAFDPRLDPRPYLSEVRGRVVLAHGRTDRLIPFTESLRLHAALPAAADSSVTITRLFAHSTGGDRMGPAETLGEGVRFLRLIDRAVRSV